MPDQYATGAFFLRLNGFSCRPIAASASPPVAAESDISFSKSGRIRSRICAVDTPSMRLRKKYSSGSASS